MPSHSMQNKGVETAGEWWGIMKTKRTNENKIHNRDQIKKELMKVIPHKII